MLSPSPLGLSTMGCISGTGPPKRIHRNLHVLLTSCIPFQEQKLHLMLMDGCVSYSCSPTPRRGVKVETPLRETSYLYLTQHPVLSTWASLAQRITYEYLPHGGDKCPSLQASTGLYVHTVEEVLKSSLLGQSSC